MYMRIKEIEVTWDGDSFEIIYNIRWGESTYSTTNEINANHKTQKKKNTHNREMGWTRRKKHNAHIWKKGMSGKRECTWKREGVIQQVQLDTKLQHP